MAKRIMVGLSILCLASIAWAAPELTIYFIDVEGGQSTLIVTPQGQSMLIDAGYAEYNGRDRDRILSAAKDAGIKRFDYLLVTHYHSDHVGGVPAIVDRMPVGTFIDYGPPGGVDQTTQEPFKNYAPVRDRGKHQVAKPGDQISLRGVRVNILSAANVLITKPLVGAGQKNPSCDSYQRRADDVSENPRSVGIELTLGRFQFLDLGDLSWNPLGQLVCPNNLIGQVDLFLVPHHTNDDSTVPAMLSAIQPRAIISNNGPTKGGSPDAMALIHRLPNIDIWQLHESHNAGAVNSGDPFLANVDDGQTGYWIKVLASPDGSFKISNQRTGASRSYSAR